MLRLLFAGDDCDVISSLKNEISNYNLIAEIASIKNAEDILRLINFDAIIIALRNNNCDICQYILRWRKNGMNKPLMIITEPVHVLIRVNMLNAGADDVMQKPVVEDEVIRRFFAMIHRCSLVRKSILCHGDISLDTGSRRVKLKDKIVRLTARETLILEMLLKQKSDFISSRRLASEINFRRDENINNTISMHISNIRKKISKDFIETLRGKGYRLR
ncbi:hypothetical protein H7D82_004330 [Salmonella enterica]|nr:hypothetical protein [Salmonella enterica]EKB7612286.1 winged helix-turn-helix domain-containing protein [Salmonella enterica]